MPVNPPNPLDTANALSSFSIQYFLSFVGALIAKGKGVTEDDFWANSSFETSRNLGALIKAAWSKEVGRGPGEASLLRAYVSVFGLRYFAHSCVLFIKSLAYFVMTYFLYELLVGLEEGRDSTSLYLNALGFTLCSSVSAMTHHAYFWLSWRDGFQWKTSALTLIMDKTLRLRLDALGALGVGGLVSIASNDLERTAKLCQMLAYTMVAPVEAVVALYLLWRVVGVYALAGYSVMAVLLVWQGQAGRLFAGLRDESARLADTRLHLTAQVVGGARVLKAFGWEAPFYQEVAKVRDAEVVSVRSTNTLRAVNEGIFNVATIVMAAVTFLSAHFLGGLTLRAADVFVALTLLQFMQMEATMFFTRAIESIAETGVLLRRLQRLLELPETPVLKLLPPPPLLPSLPSTPSTPAPLPSLVLAAHCARAHWPPYHAVALGVLSDEKAKKALAAQGKKGRGGSGGAGDATTTTAATITDVTPANTPTTTSSSSPSPASAATPRLILKGVTLEVRRGELCGVVGPVGCGKSTLLLRILGEAGDGGVCGGGESTATTTSGSSSSSIGSSTCTLYGKVSYASQTPWIITGTIKDNVVMVGGGAGAAAGTAAGVGTPGFTVDEVRYARVLKACCLEADCRAWPQGDATLVGERGVTLSGGQKARLSLARALYAGGDLYLLDDPLAAVDASVGAALFRSAICDFALGSGAAVVLVTHQVAFLRGAASVVVLDREGGVEAQGTWQQLRASAASAAAAVGDGGVAREGGGGGLGGETLNALLLAEEKEKEEDEEGGGKEKLKEKESEGGEAQGSSNTPHKPTVDIPGLSIPPPAPSSPHVTEAAPSTTPPPPPSSSSSSSSSTLSTETMAEGSIGWGVYYAYAQACAPPVTLLGLMVVMGGGTVLAIYSSVALAMWSGVARAGAAVGAEDAAAAADRAAGWVYGGVVLGALVLSMFRPILWFHLANNGSAALHRAAFARVISAPTSFFDVNPTGRILNRFSKDLAVLDDLLPWTFFDFANVTLQCIGTLALVAAVNPWLLLLMAPLCWAFFALRAAFLTVSRTVKRIEATTRSPMYSLLAECAGGGLPTIRAFPALGPALTGRYLSAVDRNGRAYWAWLATTRWLGIRLDAMCLGLLGATVMVGVALRGTLPPAYTGLLLSQIVALTNAFQWAVRQSSEVETAMVGCERILEYAHLEPVEEVDLGMGGPSSSSSGGSGGTTTTTTTTTTRGASHPTGGGAGGGGVSGEDVVVVSVAGKDGSSSSSSSSSSVPAHWPSKGEITFTDVHMRYRPTLPYVLKGLTAVVKGGSRVGVVGRTGAGKSSLLAAILRLTEPSQGGGEEEGQGQGQGRPSSSPSSSGIAIDGVDTASIHLTRLRRSIGLIPQDPHLTEGTVRKNLDPFHHHSDGACWEALDAVQLGGVMRDKGGGLEEGVEEGGVNFSTGQRQLLCLARAALRGCKLLLMDEASASVDTDTTAKIFATLKASFPTATIIAIAHRLETIADFDCVLVVCGGRVVECGPPLELMEKGEALAAGMGGGEVAAEDGPGAFWKLVSQSGNASTLKDIATRAHKERGGAEGRV